jgi:hypothetical protein
MQQAVRNAADCAHAACNLPCFVQAGTYSALGYTYHLKGDLDKAIEHYHKVGVAAGCGCWVRLLVADGCGCWFARRQRPGRRCTTPPALRLLPNTT